ncbi:putative DNA-binding helix-hairpin-helix protein [Methanohalophilus levihalophilus]|uniref:radical SAM protein n=1 Tax=Methanohalophilus levihalophilus TaxID=1431282 RepID=UPI001FDA2B12|nr:radical SAM protein [Methanohalophilus levihalophilus]MBP2030930.1 putative DNA-binding helix-hairpin-helix protein [Methanohalophilus levihalophilus]
MNEQPSGHHFTLTERMQFLSSGTKYDSCNQSAVCHAFGPDGRCIQLYKTLLTNYCSGECTYCPNRCERDVTRVSLSPEEITKITWSLYRKNAIEGLFLSSGVIGEPELTSQKQLEVATLMRQQGFNGYIHLRLMPGTPKYLLEQIAEVANKFGVNAETTNKSNYSEICPNFDYQNDVLQRLNWTDKIIQKKRREFRGTNRIVGANDTQFVVGAVNEPDSEIVNTVSDFMENYSLRRPYFMSFDPVPDTPLFGNTPSPQWREQRLYQVSFLLKEYGIKADDFDMVYDENGFLSNSDPKLELAKANRDMFPVDVNSASFSDLIRVPGIGPISADRILHSRPLFEEKELTRMGVVVGRARPFIRIHGKSQASLSDFLGACS